MMKYVIAAVFAIAGIIVATEGYLNISVSDVVSGVEMAGGMAAEGARMATPYVEAGVDMAGDVASAGVDMVMDMMSDNSTK